MKENSWTKGESPSPEAKEGRGDSSGEGRGCSSAPEDVSAGVGEMSLEDAPGESAVGNTKTGQVAGVDDWGDFIG